MTEGWEKNTDEERLKEMRFCSMTRGQKGNLIEVFGFPTLLDSLIAVPFRRSEQL